MFDPREILSAGMVLFAVIDIIGNIPLVITLREKVGHIQSGKASIVSACIMIAFLFIGEEILNLIGIDINSFAVAGSFVLLFMALEMILGVSLYRDDVPDRLDSTIGFSDDRRCRYDDFIVVVACRV